MNTDDLNLGFVQEKTQNPEIAKISQNFSENLFIIRIDKVME